MNARPLATLLLASAAAGCHAQATAPPAPPAAPRTAPADSSARAVDAAVHYVDTVDAGETDPPAGVACTVQFRRDALGMSGAAVMGPRANTPPSRSVRLAGTLERVTPRWLVLRAGDKTYWLARETVLLVEYDDSDPAAAAAR